MRGCLVSDPKPTIAILHFSAPPVVGGVEKVIDAQAGLFVDHWYRCKLVVARGEPSDDRVELCRVDSIDSRCPLNQHLAPQVKEGLRPAEYDEYRDEILGDLRCVLDDVDVVLVHNALVKDLNFAFVEAFRLYAEEIRGQKVLVNSCHDPTCAAYNVDPSLKASEEFPWSLINTPIPGVANVTLSRTRREELARIYDVPEDEVHVIPDAIDAAAFLGISPEIVHVWRSHGLIERDLVLFTPARVVPRKNIELGIRVVRELTDRGMDSALLISGPPSQHVGQTSGDAHYAEMQALAEELGIEERVLFLHDVVLKDGSTLVLTDRMIRQLYFLSDMLFLPSREEGFGLPLLEAALTKTIIVCTRLNTLVELGGDDVLYFEEGEHPGSIARKIAARLGASTRIRLFKRVVRQFNWPQVFRNHIEPFVLGRWGALTHRGPGPA